MKPIFYPQDVALDHSLREQFPTMILYFLPFLSSLSLILSYQDDNVLLGQDRNVLLITAHSPQAKGRIERLFETLQDRLVKEMRLAGILTIEEANKFLVEVFIPKFNQ